MSAITDAVLSRLGFSGNSAKMIITDSAGDSLGTPAAGIPVVDANIVPVEYAQSLDLSIVRPLIGNTPNTGLWATVPGNATIALLQAIGGDIRWRDDGIDDPTTAIGMILPEKEQFLYTGDITAIRFIEANAADTPELNVTLYRQA